VGQAEHLSAPAGGDPGRVLGLGGSGGTARTLPDTGDQGASFGWGEADEACLALSHAIIARLVSVGLVAPEQAGEKARYLRDEVLAKLPAGEHYDLHLSYLRLLLGDPPGLCGQPDPRMAGARRPDRAPLLSLISRSRSGWHLYCFKPVSVNDLSGKGRWKLAQAA